MNLHIHIEEFHQQIYTVANPPLSYKKWTSGLDPIYDIYKRFDDYAIPPVKNGDYAFLLHLIKSLKSKGKACIVLPLGVLFRGNAEASIRKKIIRRGYIKGIVGLPANLFYGTGIAASLLFSSCFTNFNKIKIVTSYKLDIKSFGTKK